MKLTSVYLASVFAAVAVGGSAAQAIPLVPQSIERAAETPGAVDKVHWRSYRHCRWRNGERWCHGGNARRRGYYSPGVSLYIGPRWGRNRGWNGRDDWRYNRRWNDNRRWN